MTESVKAFLFAWGQGDYAAAAALTTGNHRAVAASLNAAYDQLGAQDLVLSMGAVTVGGDTAHAYFHASIDLGRGGRPWDYRGSFMLRRSGSQWLVVWSPSVIVPGLGPHERLAVLTKMPPRALLLDSSGGSLIESSASYEVGVYPDRVPDVTLTARRLAHATGLAPSGADEMRDQILAAPPNSFLPLIHLTPRKYRLLHRRLRRVPHLSHQRVTSRLFVSEVPEVTGKIGTETARVLVQDGDSYLPGTTVGLSGLQQAFQAGLVGTPTTTVIVQNAAGKQVKVLAQWTGEQGKPVKTTINSGIERAARRAVGSIGVPAAIVAIRPGTGEILAVASGKGNGTLPAISPLGGQYRPGQAFTIVSTAALLAAKPGFDAQSPIPCYPTNHVNGQTFANVPAEPKLGRQPPFIVDFAHACSTAFAALSLNMVPDDLVTAAKAFGVGAGWQLPLSAFTGSMRRPSSPSSRALPSDVTGYGSVRVSPLDMALAAGVVASGSWHQPSLVVGESEPKVAAAPKLKQTVLGQLRDFMAATVASGAAKAARLHGSPLYGQVGTAPLVGHRKVRAIWFVGYRGNVAFAVLVFSHSTAFSPAVSLAHQFAAALKPQS